MTIITNENYTELDGFDVDTYESKDMAYPTSRCLSGTSDFWAAEEWAERGLINGKPCEVYYLFSPEECDGIEDAEYLPWDMDHVSRIVVMDED